MRIQSTHSTPFFGVQLLNFNIFGGFQKVIIRDGGYGVLMDICIDLFGAF